MKKFVLVLLCCFTIPAAASHIMGGEFELLHVSGNTYRVNLILYFDSLHGLAGAKDLSVMSRIFGKRDNVKKLDITMPLVSDTRVLYTKLSCSNGEIVTRKLVYSATVTLSDTQFNDAEGYYIVWERCCRNYGITNIFSEDQSSGGQIYAGQTFYLEFPPVVKDGKPFINSSPHLFPPLNDYACPKKPYYSNFGGVDDDKDSLVYSMVTPLNTQTGTPIPIIGPSPYPDVQWRNPFSLKRITGGSPDMKIDIDGLLTVTPKEQGLYVFAVQCDQYRNGVKIGLTRRDFQMLVVDACPVASPPDITGKKLTDASFIYDNAMDVTFTNTVSDADRCIQVQVSDFDSDPSRDGSENITIKAVALNFRKDISGVLPSITNATLTNGSTQTFEICFDKCPFINNVPYQIGIVAYDDACAIPLTDTLKINVLVQPPPNNAPHFITPDVSETLNEGHPKKTWPVQAVDPDKDHIVMFLLAQPAFNLDSAGISFNETGQIEDTFYASLTWDPRCTLYDFTRRKNWMLKILAGSKDQCGFNRYDTMLFDLKLNLLQAMPEFAITSLDINNPLVGDAVSITLGQQVALGLRGVENNPALQDNLIKIKMIEAKGNVEPNGYVFSPVEHKGVAETTFVWNPDCTIFQNDVYENNYSFTFVMLDNHCIVPNSDTIAIDLSIKDVDGTDDNFSPRNFITPNDDGWNDFFAMEAGIVADKSGSNPVDSDGLINFPKDNCTGRFESIRIVNRWGKEMFRSELRDFRWYAPDAAVGVYYYFLKFTNKEYKGTVTVRL